MQILVVDDEAEVRALPGWHLESRGIGVVPTSGDRAAYPGGVDLVAPGGSGSDVCLRLRDESTFLPVALPSKGVQP